MARAPMPAPAQIETPTMRRSAALAQALQDLRKAPAQIGGYGDLGARLLAQGITKWSGDRAEKAARTEREQRMASQRDTLLAGLPSLDGGAASSAPSAGPASVPVPAPSPLPPAMPFQPQTLEDVLLAGATPSALSVAPAQPTTLEGALLSGQLPVPPSPAAPASPMPAAPQAMPAPAQNPRGPTPQEVALIRQAAQSGDPGQLAWAQQTWGEIQMRMATPPEIDIAVAPDGTTYNRLDPASINRRFARVENVNGFLRDVNDPNNVNQYIPDLSPGEEPVYGPNGNIVGVRNIDGSIEALGQRTRATSDAQNASRASYAGIEAGAVAGAQSPYQVERVIGPNGEIITIPRSDLLASGGMRGQAPVEAILAEGAARRDVATGDVTAQRSREAPERVRRYEEALALIPKAITGFGADARVAAARVAAASGNQDARNAVAATEVYQNLIGRDIGAIVRDMVGSANISNSDRDLATRIAGGDTNITPQALTRIVNYELSRQTGYLAASGQPISAAQARRLPRGTEFTGEDGQRYRVP